MSKKDLGKLGEKLACEYLKKKGFQIITTNYTCIFGETDIVAKDNEFLSFVEVKTRTNRNFGIPEEFINKRKIWRMGKCVECYLQNSSYNNLTPRLDALAVEINDGKVTRIELIKNISL